MLLLYPNLMKDKLLTNTFLAVVLFFLFPQLVVAQSPTRIIPTYPESSDIPRLTIISPSEGGQIFGSRVAVSFIVNNFIFAYDGHLHIFLDQEEETSANAQEITKAIDFTLEDVPEGQHKLVLELVNNDHTSLKPKKTKEVHFSTSQPKPTNLTATPSGIKTQEENKRLEGLNTLTLLSVTVILFVSLIGIFGYFVLKAKSQ